MKMTEFDNVELSNEEAARFGPALKEIVDGTLPSALPQAFVKLIEETAQKGNISFEEAATAVASKYPNVYETYRRDSLSHGRLEY